jgi:hypothetical protein
MSTTALGGRVLAALLALSTLAACSAGCGESGGNSAGGNAGEPLTKAQYVRAATALCRRHRRQIAGELNQMGAGPPFSAVAVKGAFDDVVLPGFRAEYEALRKLPIPPGDEHFLRLMQSKFEASLGHGEEDLARLFRIKRSDYSEFAEGTLMTHEYGIEGCGSPRRSARAVLAAF